MNRVHIVRRAVSNPNWSKYWKIPLAYLLYLLGDMVSDFGHATDWNTYRLYNWCMSHSADLDEWDILWKSASDGDNPERE